MTLILSFALIEEITSGLQCHLSEITIDQLCLMGPWVQSFAQI